jgi:sulfoxide reductase catalytic subunit YedY
MLIKKAEDIKSSEITPQGVYLNRRNFLRGAALTASVVGTAWLYREFATPDGKSVGGEKIEGVREAPSSIAVADEKKTSYEDITHYNNFYEFSTDKRAVASKARNFVTRPWTVEVEGLCNKPRVFDIDEVIKLAGALEERVYRHRCVEAWSMVIPWVGFPLARLLNAVEPTSQAKYVQFVTLADANQMPNIRSDVLDWPYVEGLRMDEALHPLAILATGLYDETLPPQNGAPLRLVVPWKYGFKSIKSIVKLRLIAQEPPATWNLAAPEEYGFYSNVNPQVDHPRWSQKRERRIGEFGLRDTLMFNGYGDQVASLYTGMDLRKYF